MASQTTVSTSHGVKRRHTGTDDLDGAQRLSKRFHLLKIDHNGQPTAQVAQPNLFIAPPRALHDAEHMQIEDTKHRVYIHDLDQELAVVSAEEKFENRLVFLPDIDRHLSKVHKKMLAADEELQGPQGNELVVYGVPESLSVPKEHDSVRKAIIESRARARGRPDEDITIGSRDTMLHDTDATDGGHQGFHPQDYNDEIHDPDAMDIG